MTIVRTFARTRHPRESIVSRDGATEVSRASTGSNRLLEVLSEVDRGLRGSPLRLIVPNASDGGPP